MININEYLLSKNKKQNNCIFYTLDDYKDEYNLIETNKYEWTDNVTVYFNISKELKKNINKIFDTMIKDSFNDYENNIDMTENILSSTKLKFYCTCRYNSDGYGDWPQLYIMLKNDTNIVAKLNIEWDNQNPLNFISCSKEDHNDINEYINYLLTGFNYLINISK